MRRARSTRARADRSGLLRCSPSGAPGVRPDQYGVVVDEAVGRHEQVGGRWDSVEYAAREIELRAVAWAKEPARPSRPEIGRGHVEARERRAAEVRADALEHEERGLDAAMLVLRVL